MKFLFCLLLCISVFYLAECSIIDGQDRVKRQLGFANMINPFGVRRPPPRRHYRGPMNTENFATNRRGRGEREGYAIEISTYAAKTRL
ncbi:unnamed protein product [Cylicocyclus nassatus]|uniref:Uncharacterized protein n=1 Tax=Cylicocyclus nassatus TaxID=53992 RepID=A0AA36H6N6_CYLNA|nr:unnamed protein product [Cylicocyclus nassatus]